MAAPQELSLSLSQNQKQEQVQLSELAQRFEKFHNIELARHLPDFLEWYFGAIRSLSRTGLLIVPIAGRNSSGKSSTADVIEHLLRADPESIKEALSGDKKYDDVVNYLIGNSHNIRIANCSITLALEAAKRKEVVPSNSPIGGLDQEGYRKVTSFGYELVEKKLKEGYSAENPLVLIIQQGVPTIYPDKQIYDKDFSDYESRKISFPDFIKHWNGRDRFNSICLYLSMHPDFSDSTYPIFLLRTQEVLERGLETRNTLLDLSEADPYKRIRKGNLSPIIFNTPDQDQILEKLPDEIVKAIELIISIGQMPPHQIDTVTSQQKTVIRQLGKRQVRTEEGLYRHLLETIGRPSLDDSVYIAHNEFMDINDMTINLRLLLRDLAINENPEYFGLTTESLAYVNQLIDNSIAQSRASRRRLTDST